MKVWITNYALSDGIKEVEATIDHKGWAVFESRSDFRYLHPSEFSRSKADAIAVAEGMRAKRVASLRRQIAKLEAMKFD